ncbi:hypothetical protein CBS101457_000789 [Exobasidium rhododendri]|nr:hypothetical protein CBS101457_000789 [Exobasidium rhododendri]
MNTAAGLDQGYDPNVCYMEWPEGDWFWVQPASYCSGASSTSSSQNCTWDLGQGWHNTKTPVPIPDAPYLYPYTNTYICDNQHHDLDWPDYRKGFKPNHYICACGQALSNTTNCTGRCNIPWKAANQKKCNLISQVDTKGNFSAFGGSQGVCVTATGQGTFQLNTNDSIVALDPNQLKPDSIAIIDGFGLTQTCFGGIFNDSFTDKLCNCEGALPEYVFDRKVLNRDPCGIAGSDRKAWIAGPVIGSIALLAAIGVTLYFLIYRKRGRGTNASDIGAEDDMHLEAVAHSNRINAVQHTDSLASNSSSQESGSQISDQIGWNSLTEASTPHHATESARIF